MTHKEYADSLRAVAGFYETHEEIGLPDTTISNYSMDEKEDAAKLIRALGACEKHYRDELLTIRKTFGAIACDFVFYRNRVCARKVIGVKEIPELIVPAHTEEIVEWECEPILAATESAPSVATESTEEDIQF